jgi:ribonuclease E
MSWFTNIEKKIADGLVSTFSKAKEVETTVQTTVIADVEKVEQLIVKEEKSVFDETHQAALDANSEVNKLKADLQSAMAKAAQLHQDAVNAANAAREAAEADVAKFKAMAASHAADLVTQTSAQTIVPVQVAQPAPVVEAPVVEAPTPVVEAPAPVTTPVVVDPTTGNVSITTQ